jgi:calcineurin-like phosphoesterase family protein
MICKCLKGKQNLIKGRHQKFSNQKKAVTREILNHFDDIFFPEEDIHFLSPKLEPEMKEMPIGTLFGLKNELLDNSIVISGIY